jgi:N-6 DNA Methylase
MRSRLFTFMPTSSGTRFLTIRAEGALLPVDLLQRIVENDHDLGGLSPESYHLSGEKLNEAINRSWNRLLGAWAAFSSAAEKLPETDPGTSVTREKWLLPLFDELDYGRLQTTKAIEIEGKSYPVSHGWNEAPIHLVGLHARLDTRTSGVVGAAKASPHSLVQELLNRSPERLWGFVSNGLRMRVLRDNASLTHQAYLEFDLEAMMNGEVYADFVVLWLVCHQSRVESREQRRESCWLEMWSKAAQERGTRALDGLRVGVEKAIQALGRGFIGHPANGSLRSALHSGTVDRMDLYRQLLRLVYRLIFLFVAEDRQLLYNPMSDVGSRERYARFYSTARLRRMAERVRGSRHADLYAALKLVMDKLGNGGAPELGLPALGGFLFSRSALSALADCELSNAGLLEAVRSLGFMQDDRTRRAVDYKNLGSEELGSIYESLLELHPLVNTDAATFELTAVSGSERKTTGSYYTPSSLIQVLLDSALEPVIAQALDIRDVKLEGREMTAETRSLLLESRLLNLKVVDPACGSGHFLVAAAHRLARRLATVRTGEGEPAPPAIRAALRAVISNCIYGVDVNPMSVELCKVSLWMEALEPGKPLSFLDSHIQCGDSLVGVSPDLDISEIPDEAFDPAFGDDKATASGLKKRNKRERGGSHSDRVGQLGFRFEATHMTNMQDLARWLAERAAQVDAMPEDDSTELQAKAKAFDDYHATSEYLKNRFELDLWTASFFWNISKSEAESMLAPTQQELVQLRNGGKLDARLVERVKELAKHLNFFHWELAFPKVFSGDASTGTASGFDCVLGNPPWERIKLQEEEFFAQRDTEIASAPNKAARQKLIDALTHSNPALAQAFEEAKHAADAQSKFARGSGRFALTAIGDVNTYALFAEHARNIISLTGYSGIIVPIGILTDDTFKDFFSDLMNKHQIVSSIGFENEALIFRAVHHSFKFCILSISGCGLGENHKADFVFYCRYLEHIQQPERHFQLSSNDIKLINPLSHTCPIFRTGVDAGLTQKFYEIAPSFVADGINSWNVQLMAMFHMSNDSHLFHTENDSNNLPLYEAKLMHQYDHRWATYEKSEEARLVTIEEKQNFNFAIQPRYWISNKDLEQKIGRRDLGIYFPYRKVTSAISERTVISTVLCHMALGESAWIVVPDTKVNGYFCLLANFNSIPLDYIARQKLGGVNLNFSILKQLPVLPPSAYTPADIDFITPRVLELVYTAYDLRPFAEDMGYHGEPFRWDEVRRAQIRAELDAYYGRLYGLTRDELRYILDPKEVHGEDFPGETFRVLKEKEMRLYGEYRTRRLVLEAWDELVG